MLSAHRGCAPAAARHVDAGPGLVKKHQPGSIPVTLLGVPLTPCPLHVGALLLAGVQRSFRAQPPVVQLMPKRRNLDVHPAVGQPLA